MKLSNILLEYKIDFKIERISIGYTDYGRFYGIYLYSPPSEDNPYNNWKEKIRFFDDAKKFIKDLTGLELPRDYSYEELDKIVDVLRKKGYDADHDDAMDVS